MNVAALIHSQEAIVCLDKQSDIESPEFGDASEEWGCLTNYILIFLNNYIFYKFLMCPALHCMGIA
eukprot:6125486-Amphidinium_carterae.1